MQINLNTLLYLNEVLINNSFEREKLKLYIVNSNSALYLYFNHLLFFDLFQSFYVIILNIIIATNK